MARPKGILSTPPPKPRKNFPLFAHAAGSWGLKINGSFKSFGGWKNDPKGEAAYIRFRQWEDARKEGREPEPVRVGELTCRDVVNTLLDDRLAKMEAGELSAASYYDYRNACKSFLEIIGPDRNPYDLKPHDFASVVKQWGETRGPQALGRWIQLVRTAFRHAGPDGIGLMDRPPRYGGMFKKPPAKARRKAIREAEEESGKRVFGHVEIKRMLAESNPTLKACILLGLNCGFLAIDCARLTPKDIDLDRRWLELVRLKTETHRMAVLWPETVAAIRSYLENRPLPVDDADESLLFLTREGRPLVHDAVARKADGAIDTVHRCDALNQAMRDVLDRLKIKRKGVSFSALRKTFRTAADELGDTNAVNLVMGHNFGGMAQFYVRAIAEPRLKRVADHVRTRLLKSQRGSAPSESRSSGASADAKAHSGGTAKTPGSRSRARGNDGSSRRPRRSRKPVSRTGKGS